MLTSGLTAAAVLLLSPVTALTQRTPNIDGRRLRQRTDTFAQYMISSLEHDTVRTDNVIETVRIDANSVVHIVLALEDPVQQHADTLVERLPHLSPLAQHTHRRTTSGFIGFAATQVRGWLQLENGDTVHIDASLPNPSYNAADFDLIVRAADLQDDTRLELTGFSIYSNAIVPLRGRVTGTEVVDGRRCWVFRGTNGTTPVTLWIDRETRDLCRELIQVAGGFAFLETSRPRGEAASLTRDELTGLVVEGDALRHTVFGFTIPLPSSDFAPYDEMNDALRGMLGHRQDLSVWAYRIPGDSFIRLAVVVQKGFAGTEEAFRRFPKDLLNLGPTGDDVSYKDSIVWNGQQREYLIMSQDKGGIVSRVRCVPSPESRKPALIVCVLLTGGFPSQVRRVLEGPRFTTDGP